MSAYLRERGIAPARIGVYPKRYGRSSFPRTAQRITQIDVLQDELRRGPVSAPDLCYADFFVSAAAAPTRLGTSKVA